MLYTSHQVVPGPTRAPQSFRAAFARPGTVGTMRHFPNVRDAKSSQSYGDQIHILTYIVHAIQQDFIWKSVIIITCLLSPFSIDIEIGLYDQIDQFTPF